MLLLADYKGKIKYSLETLHEGIQTLKSKGFAVESIKPMGALYLTIKLDYVGKTTPKGQKLNDTTDFSILSDSGSRYGTCSFLSFW